MDRWVLHLDMDAFFASVEQLTRPTLRGRPVLVGGRADAAWWRAPATSPGCYGARSAMPMHQARRLVGATAVVLPPRGVVYGVASRACSTPCARSVPVLEQLSFDEAFGEPAELAGAAAVDVEAFCEELRAEVRDRDGAGRLRRRRIGQAGRQDRLRPGQTRRHPRGLAATRNTCCSTGCRCGGCGASGRWPRRSCTGSASRPSVAFAALSDTEAANILGATVGPALHRLAQGIDDRPVAENAPAKQISAESTFPDRPDHARPAARSGRPDRRARAPPPGKDGRGARTVTVKLKKSDMSILTRSATLPYATADAATLIATARRLLLDPVEIGPIRLVGVGFSGLSMSARSRCSRIWSWPRKRCHDTGFHRRSPTPPATPPAWRLGDDVTTPNTATAGSRAPATAVMTVRFETRSTGPGPVRTFPETLPDNAPTRSTAWTGLTTSASWRPAQPQRATTSSTGEPLASAAISSTRACGGRRTDDQSTASTSSRPGP